MRDTAMKIRIDALLTSDRAYSTVRPPNYRMPETRKIQEQLEGTGGMPA
jgi:hypothetical protein